MDEEPGHAVVMGEGRVALLRLVDGRVVRSLKLEVVQQPMIVWRSTIYAFAGSKLVVIRNWKVEEERPLPGPGDGLALDRLNGNVYLASGHSLYLWEAGWKLLGRAPTPLCYLYPTLGTGRFYARDVFFDGENLQPYVLGTPFQAVFSAWQSLTDPTFVVVRAYPRTGVSRDAGRSWFSSEADLYGYGCFAGYEFPGGRLLFAHTNSGKMSLGRILGVSTLWISRDDGLTFAATSMPSTVAVSMEVVGNTLIIGGQDGSVWAADIINHPK